MFSLTLTMQETHGLMLAWYLSRFDFKFPSFSMEDGGGIHNDCRSFILRVMQIYVHVNSNIARA